MKIDVIIIGVVAAASGLYALFSSFGITGAVAGFAVMAVYALLLKIKPKRVQEKTIFQNIRFKLPFIFVLSCVIWIVAGKFNFPVWWQIEFVAFAFVGFFFFTTVGLENAQTRKNKF